MLHNYIFMLICNSIVKYLCFCYIILVQNVGLAILTFEPSDGGCINKQRKSPEKNITVIPLELYSLNFTYSYILECFSLSMGIKGNC